MGDFQKEAKILRADGGRSRGEGHGLGRKKKNGVWVMRGHGGCTHTMAKYGNVGTD